MLKNKKAVYILIPLNLLIWGFFIFRFYSAYADTDMPHEGLKNQNFKIEALKDSIAYKLNLQYKDPFLKATKNERSSIDNTNLSNRDGQQAKKTITVKTTTISPQKQLPEVKYLGLIKNNTSGQSTALISVNGQSKLIKPNEAFDGILFKSFNNDSLVAKWGKERIVVRK